MTNQQIADMARKVKTAIETHGWVKGRMIEERGVCLRGATLEVHLGRVVMADLAERAGGTYVDDEPTAELVAEEAERVMNEIESGSLSPFYEALCQARVRRDAWDSVPTSAGCAHWTMQNWNDRSVRTVEEVYELLDRVIEKYSQQEEFILTDKSEEAIIRTVAGLTASYK